MIVCVGVCLLGKCVCVCVCVYIFSYKHYNCKCIIYLNDKNDETEKEKKRTKIEIYISNTREKKQNFIHLLSVRRISGELLKNNNNKKLIRFVWLLELLFLGFTHAILYKNLNQLFFVIIIIFFFFFAFQFVYIYFIFDLRILFFSPIFFLCIC